MYAIKTTKQTMFQLAAEIKLTFPSQTNPSPKIYMLYIVVKLGKINTKKLRKKPSS